MRPVEHEERGEYLGSFKQDVEGETLLEITDKAEQFAREQSSEARDIEVRVFEISVF